MNKPKIIWIVLITDHDGEPRGAVLNLPAEQARALLDAGVAMPATDLPKPEEPQE